MEATLLGENSLLIIDLLGDQLGILYPPLFFSPFPFLEGEGMMGTHHLGVSLETRQYDR
jgi:hypothetical protein